jgi:hypothetical protein
MDGPASVEGLVVAGWVDGHRAEELALLGHDPDLSASREDVDRFVPVSGSDADVSEPAAVAQGDRAGLVDGVVTDAILDGSELSRSMKALISQQGLSARVTRHEPCSRDWGVGLRLATCRGPREPERGEIFAGLKPMSRRASP